MNKSVPWVHWGEWKEVRSWFTSKDESLQLKAIQRVRIWEQRGNVPTSADSTANLYELLHQIDNLSNSSLSVGSPQLHRPLRLAASLAIVRFVNGLVDSEQKSFFAKSVEGIATELNLPVYFVDMRHDATHNELPALPILRDALQKALEWLDVTYWKVQHEVGEGLASRVVEYLKSYISEYEAHGEESVGALSTIKQILNQSYLNVLVASLLEMGFLVPVRKDERASLENLEVSKKLLEMWGPALHYFQLEYPEFATVLMEGIIEKVQSDDLLDGSSSLDTLRLDADPSKKKTKASSASKLFTLVAWARYLLEWDSLENNKVIRLAPAELLRTILVKPTKYKILILMDFEKNSTNPKVKASLKKGIKLAKEMLKSGSAEELPEEEDWEREETPLHAGSGDNPSEPENLWTTCLPGEWASCPLGSLPANVYPSLELPLHAPRTGLVRKLSQGNLAEPMKKKRKQSISKESSEQPDPRRKGLEKLKGKITMF